MPIDEFDPASVEHGELKARVSSLDVRVASLEARQQQTTEVIASLRGAQWLIMALITGLSAIVGSVAIIRKWF